MPSCARYGRFRELARNRGSSHAMCFQGTRERSVMRKKVKPLDVVALLDDQPEAGLIEGQVGTVVERLDDTTVLVEFADDSGVAYAITTVSDSRLLVLTFDPEPA